MPVTDFILTERGGRRVLHRSTCRTLRTGNLRSDRTRHEVEDPATVDAHRCLICRPLQAESDAVADAAGTIRVSLRPLRRVQVPGASGWGSPDGRWRFLKFWSHGGHPMAGRWIVQERMNDTDDPWFAHDVDYDTLQEALEYAQECVEDEAATANGRGRAS